MFARYAEIADRIAVIDTETTGVYNNDRVLEVAVVTLDLGGTVIDRWDTLVNPGRDVGPTWIHGITPTMLTGAPSFEEIADELTIRLHGAILCAHNLPFDTRMLRHEYQRIGIQLVTADGFDTLRHTGCKLDVACQAYGIRRSGEAHRALNDAVATAELAVNLANHLPPSVHAVVGLTALGVGGGRRHTRDGLQVEETAPAPFLASVLTHIEHKANPGDLATYIALLDHAMADLRLDTNERQQLAELAAELGLTPTEIDRANRLWLADLIAAAAADGVIDEDEYDQLLLAAYALFLAADEVAQRTATMRARLTAVQLRPGMGVTFTGQVAPSGHYDQDDMTFAREALEAHARGLGLRLETSFTKSRTEALIAGDPSTASSKATKARQWGIPLISAEQFRALTSLDQILDGWIPIGAGREIIECTGCGTPYPRTKTRGAKPKTCEACPS